MPSALVTGASRGIGQATALTLAGHGWHVYAGVRRPQDGVELAAHQPGRITPVELDITVPDQIKALAGTLPEQLEAVVNNAGIVVGGPVEAVPVDELRRQLEVNVVAQQAVTQAVLPRLRRSRGRIVFVSSLSGRVSTPLMGAYNASKFALEALADALRMELAPWGVHVSLVEPAQTDTDIWRHAPEMLEGAVAALSPEHRALYAAHIEGLRRSIPRSQRMAASPQGVAATIEKALSDRRPRARYVVGRSARLALLLAQLTPTPLRDSVLRRATGVPPRA